MRKAKVAAITMGVVASLLFGGYAVADAATVTLDESAEISTSKARIAAQSPSASNIIILTEAVESYEDYVPLYVPFTTITSQQDIDSLKEELQTPVETTPETTELPEETTSETRIFVKSTAVSTKASTAPETTSKTVEVVAETTSNEEQIPEETVPAETKPAQETSAEAVYTVADITTAPHKETTTEETTETTTETEPEETTEASSETSASTTKETTTTSKATTTTTTTTTTETTTTTTEEPVSTTEETTTEPVITTVETTTEAIITTVETTTEPAIVNPEVVEIPEEYLDDFFDSDYTEIEEEFIDAEEAETAPEVDDDPEFPVEETQPVSYFSISDSEYVLLCNCVAHEAGSESISIENKAKVVEVIMNRVASSSFPDSIYGVITQKSQFSGSSSYADNSTYTSKVTQNVKAAVDLYFSDPSAFDHGYLYFYGDGSQNHFSS